MMQVKKNIVILPTMLLLMFIGSGCPIPEEPAESIVLPAKDRPSESVAKRFQEPASKGATAVASAIELSEKYAKLSNEAALLRQENLDLITRNQQFKDRIVFIESQLQRSQKELNEANDLLIEMHIELNNWKTDVLGFRDEMRDAEKAQLEALLKILVVLGGEAKEDSVPVQAQSQMGDEESVVALLNKPGESESQKIESAGKSNE